jgi:hypothetical protein
MNVIGLFNDAVSIALEFRELKMSRHCGKMTDADRRVVLGNRSSR